MSRTRTVLLFLAATVFLFIVASALFFGLLALWGLVLAPFLRLSSSSLVIFCAFVLAVAGSSLVYRAVLKRFAHGVEHSSGDPLTKS